ncbi:MAG: hypothetical protein ACYC3X_14145 [Pirellulaceae bacterium]
MNQAGPRLRRFGCALAAILAVAGGVLSHTAAHGPQEVHPAEPASSIPDRTQERLEYFYRLFSDLCHRCPTAQQAETLERAESIYELLHGFHAQPPIAADVARVETEAVRHYERVCAEYALVRLQWNEQDLTTVTAAPIALARGITRHVLVELTRTPSPTPTHDNTAIGLLHLSFRRSGLPESATPPQAIPLSETRALPHRLWGNWPSKYWTKPGNPLPLSCV